MSGLHVEQDEGCETKMIWTCEEEYRRITPQRRCEMLVVEDIMKGKVGPKKYWEGVIR